MGGGKGGGAFSRNPYPGVYRNELVETFGDSSFPSVVIFFQYFLHVWQRPFCLKRLLFVCDHRLILEFWSFQSSIALDCPPASPPSPSHAGKYCCWAVKRNFWGNRVRDSVFVVGSHGK